MSKIQAFNEHHLSTVLMVLFFNVHRARSSMSFNVHRAHSSMSFNVHRAHSSMSFNVHRALQ